jgi:hypothetical protein
MGRRTSIYLDDDLQAAVKASGVPLAELIRRGLTTANEATSSGTADSPEPKKTAATPLGAIGPGEPTPGTICMTPNCFQRDTRTYGLRNLPLCTACAHALQGQEYKRPGTERATRALRRGAALQALAPACPSARIRHMNTVVWTTLITATATVTASLGAVWIKSHFDDRTQARQTKQNRATAREEQQRQAYGELVKTARLALRNFYQLCMAYRADAPNIPAVEQAFSQTASLAADLNQAAALAELAGTPNGRQHARTIYDKARECAELFQAQELVFAANPPTDPATGKLLGPVNPGGTGKRRLFAEPNINRLIAEIETAIDQFIEAANTELGQ